MGNKYLISGTLTSVEADLCTQCKEQIQVDDHWDWKFVEVD